MTDIVTTNNDVFLEISRNMKYGAPELKQLYTKFLTRGLICAVVIATVLSVSSLAYILFGKNITEIPQNQERTITLTETSISIPVEVPPEETVQKPALKDLGALIPKPVPKKNVKDNVKIKSQSELEEVKLPVSSDGTEDVSKVTSEMVTGKIEEKKVEQNIEKQVEKTKESFEQFEVETAPVAVNLNSVRGSMHYPEIARQAGIEGRVTVKVLVGTDGSVIKLGGIKGEDVFHDEVADKVMSLQFTPALKNNQKVKCWVTVPFSFKLGNGDKKNYDE